MSNVFNHDPLRTTFANKLGAALAVCLAFTLLCGGKALAAQKNITKVGATAESPMPEGPPLARDMLPREVELVVVWGFRIRSTEHDFRMASIRSGYSELIDKTVCTTAICGFVVLQDGAKWRATNVIATSESELRDMQRTLEREGTTLVIVHPTGSKRTIPSF
jgi:hypothetical protein